MIVMFIQKLADRERQEEHIAKTSMPLRIDLDGDHIFPADVEPLSSGDESLEVVLGEAIGVCPCFEIVREFHIPWEIGIVSGKEVFQGILHRPRQMGLDLLPSHVEVRRDDLMDEIAGRQEEDAAEKQAAEGQLAQTKAQPAEPTRLFL